MEEQPNGSMPTPGLVNVFSKTDLGPAATLFVDRVTGGIGAAAAPLMKVYKAWIKNQVAAVEHAGAMEREVRKRAGERLLQDEVRRQVNIDSITYKALPHLTDGYDAGLLNDDWLARFREKAGTVSNPEAQEHWAKLLAGETTKPGTFSTKTVEVLSNLDTEDALLFAKLCCFATGDGPKCELLVFDLKDSIYKNSGITHVSLRNLVSLDLIHYEGIGEYLFSATAELGSFTYFGRSIMLKNLEPKHPLKFSMGKASFTRAGSQLCGITSRSPIPGFLEYIAARLTTKTLKAWILPSASSQAES